MEHPRVSMHRYDEIAVARVCHAALRELRLRDGEPAAPLWGDLDPGDRDYLTGAVLAARQGVSLAVYHDSWVAVRRAEGWTDGPGNLSRRTRPDLVPFSKLPPERRIATRVCLMIVTAMTDLAT